MTKALFVIDVQIDFCESGVLACAGGAITAKRITEHLKRVITTSLLLQEIGTKPTMQMVATLRPKINLLISKPVGRNIVSKTN
jgi:nicotinamidase-related amidase